MQSMHFISCQQSCFSTMMILTHTQDNMQLCWGENQSEKILKLRTFLNASIQTRQNSAQARSNWGLTNIDKPFLVYFPPRRPVDLDRDSHHQQKHWKMSFHQIQVGFHPIQVSFHPIQVGFHPIQVGFQQQSGSH